MDCIGTPNIKVYSRRVNRGATGSPARPFALSDSEDEAADASKGRQQHQMTYRIEDDLNWASKYLSSDRGSSTPRSRRSGASPADDAKAPCPAPGKHFGSSHLEDSGTFGRRSKSPSTFSENSEDDVMRGAAKRNGEYYNVPLHFRIGSASPVAHRNPATAKKGYLELRGGSVISTSPSMSKPVTRTYVDLDMSRSEPRTKSYVALNTARSGARTHTDFDVPFSGARFKSDVERSRTGTRIQTDSDSALATRNSKTAKRPVSETRKKLRNLLCRTRNDPHYFDDDF